MICARCKAEFTDADEGAFITCPGCRIPDNGIHKAKRYRWTRKNRDSTETNPGFDDVVRANEEDR